MIGADAAPSQDRAEVRGTDTPLRGASWITAWMGRFGRRLDRRLLRLTGRRLSLNGPSVVLLLHTTGRRSGLPRKTPLILVREGEDCLVTSEDFGRRRPAGWPLNLAANPEAVVMIGRRSFPVRPRLLSETEADDYWARLVEVCPASRSSGGATASATSTASCRPAAE
jgi:deazaflavin-dependent oxidoreductase (nitroreductase family)